jgi:hypothetical protein
MSKGAFASGTVSTLETVSIPWPPQHYSGIRPEGHRGRAEKSMSFMHECHYEDGMGKASFSSTPGSRMHSLAPTRGVTVEVGNLADTHCRVGLSGCGAGELECGTAWVVRACAQAASKLMCSYFTANLDMLTQLLGGLDRCTTGQRTLFFWLWEPALPIGWNGCMVIGSRKPFIARRQVRRDRLGFLLSRGQQTANPGTSVPREHSCHWKPSDLFLVVRQSASPYCWKASSGATRFAFGIRGLFCASSDVIEKRVSSPRFTP